MKSKQTLTPTEVGKLSVIMLWGFCTTAVLLIIFFIFSESLTSPWLERLDESMGDMIRAIRSDWLTVVALGITFMGKGSTEFIIYAIIASFLIFKFKHAWEALVIFLGVLGAWGLNELFKAIFQRDRPAIEWLADADGYSFPSGHAMVSTSFYGLIGYLLWINLRGKWKGAWIIPVLTILFFIGIGFSRVYLGVHHPSDVLAGFAAGGAWLAGCIIGIQVVREHKRKRGRL